MCVLLQVTRPGAIDPSAVDTTEDQAIIGKARKKVWILTVVGYCALFILWPCLMAPAGGTWSIGYFRSEPLHLSASPTASSHQRLLDSIQGGNVCHYPVDLNPAYWEVHVRQVYKPV